MALPCICHKCARCLSLESLRDPGCRAVEEEEKNCDRRNCSSCDFTCERFTEKWTSRPTKACTFIRTNKN